MWCHKSGDCAKSCARVYISVFLKSERWTCQHYFAYTVVAITWLRQEGRRLCETRTDGPHAKWRGLCWYNPVIPASSLHTLFRWLCNIIFISRFRLWKSPSVHSFRVLFFVCYVSFMWQVGTTWTVRYLNPSRGKRYSFFQNCKARLRDPPNLVLNAYRVSFSVEERPDREVDHSRASSSEVKNKWICTSVPSFLPPWRR